MDKLDDQKRDGGSRDMETSWGFGIIVHRYTMKIYGGGGLDFHLTLYSSKN
jgi:hypothetical protein